MKLKVGLSTICFLLIFILAGCGMNNLPKTELLGKYDSPDSKHTINIYLGNGHATVDFSIVGELVDNSTKRIKNIYFAYHEYEATVKWIDNETVIINDHKLNIYKDKYDWRKEY